MMRHMENRRKQTLHGFAAASHYRHRRRYRLICGEENGFGRKPCPSTSTLSSSMQLLLLPNKVFQDEAAGPVSSLRCMPAYSPKGCL